MKRTALLLMLLTLAATTRATDVVLYDPAAPGSAEKWQFYGVKGENVKGATRVTFEGEGIAYMLWNFKRNWTDRERLEVELTAASEMTVGVAVFDDFESCAIRTQVVKAGPAKIVFPLSTILPDGIQTEFIKKIVLWAKAKDGPAVVTLGRVRLTGKADTRSVPKNWLTLCDGEGPLSESMWEQFRSGRVKAVSEHVTQGKRSIRLQFNGGRYCSAFGFIQPDWRGYGKLVMDVFNPTDEVVKLRIGVRPGGIYQNKVEGPHIAELKPGANHVVCDLKAMAAEAERESGQKFDFSILQNLPLRLPENKKTVMLYFDDVHLEGPNAKRPRPIPAFLTKSHESDWYARFGLKDDAFATEPLSPEEIAGEKPVRMMDLSKAPAGRLMAGVAKINILPTDSRRGRGRKVLSNCYARAVVLSDGKTKAAIVTVDILAAWGPATDVSQQIAAKLTDIPEENIFIWATHNHSGPHAWGPIGRGGYKKDVSEWVASAIVRARQQLRPVRVRGAKGNVDLNFNRRFISPEGKGIGFLWHKYLEKHWDRAFVDKEMGLVVLEDDAGKLVTSLVMYSGHANMNCVIDRTYNADFPGVTCTTLERSTGAPVLFINGGFGNVDVKGNALSLERTVRAGLDVARAVEELRGRLKPLKAMPIRCGTLSRQAAPFGDRPPRTVTVEALAFGDMGFTQPPGELYSEFSRDIKKSSPYPFTFTTFWRGGYLPTRAATREGGYQTNRGPDWGELSRDLSIELLNKLHAN